MDFHLRVSDTNGAPAGSFESFFPTNSIIISGLPFGPDGVTGALFGSNAVPAYVDFEVGILEPQVWEQYKSIPVAAAQQKFFFDQAAHEHLFRQRIAIRNADPSAYRYR